MHDHDWFLHLFGFSESTDDRHLNRISYVQQHFHCQYISEQPSISDTMPARCDLWPCRVIDKGWVLINQNAEEFPIGHFWTPSLKSLRQYVIGPSPPCAARGPPLLSLAHVAVDSVFDYHALHPNAVFQVASQFNCLEFPNPDVTPEHGITEYCVDNTQGPACALAAAAGTLFRNYFVNTTDDTSTPHYGQSRDRQINNLADFQQMLSMFYQKYSKNKNSTIDFINVRNGYTHSTSGKLRQLRDLLCQLSAEETEQLRSSIRIGVHAKVGVNFSKKWEKIKENVSVTQTFCSAISCKYSAVSVGEWEPLATMVLDATYEATLLAAVYVLEQQQGNGKVFLTKVGAGVFGNEIHWVVSAIANAIVKMQHYPLDIVICHYKHIDASFVELLSLQLEKQGCRISIN